VKNELYGLAIILALVGIPVIVVLTVMGGNA
jgi:hypothetical protein